MTKSKHQHLPLGAPLIFVIQLVNGAHILSATWVIGAVTTVTSTLLTGM